MHTSITFHKPALEFVGHYDVSDYNNALKLGFNPSPPSPSFPTWLSAQEFSHILPTRVYPPGAAVAQVTRQTADRIGLPQDCVVCAGTTDSIAAFLAAGVSTPGAAVTSLGSTLAVKLLSESPVQDASKGVYSHWVAGVWLVGGASNSGGAVLRWVTASV